ncbi:MAG: preprotein translocase subunit SecE [Clostridia bacterium]|nr:preprotein translocase subunit SecE [Clostridia bacterium]
MVLIICLLVGALIWICDKGLGELIKLIMTKRS